MMEFILSHVEKGVMTLTLNRPERLNSFNDEMHAQLAECLKQVERDDTIRCLLLTGCIDSREVRKKPGGYWIIRDLTGLDLVGLASL